MKHFIKKKGALLALLFVLIIVTGCQSISGVDLNKVLINQMTSDSVEGSMNISLHLTSEPSANADPEMMEVIHAINDMQIVVESFKLQDTTTMSAKGKFVITRGEIPFHITLNPAIMVLQIEGANVPIIIPIDMTTNPLSSLTSTVSADGLITNPLDTKAIAQSLVSLVVKHLANPQDISISHVRETVNGESLSLYKIHSNIKGPEILTLLKKSLRSLVMDDQGMKLFIAQLYDVLEANATEEDDNYLGLGLGFGFGSADRELEIEFIHTTIKQSLLIFIMMIEDEFMEGEILPIKNDATYLSSDLYVDSSLNVRKTDFELSISPDVYDDRTDLSGISTIQITGQGEFWNHNKAVTVDTIPYESDDVYYMDDMYYDMEQFISIVDQQSILYQLLREDFHATRKTVMFYADDEWNEYFSYELAIFKNGVMNVPARTLAEDLGLQLEWNGVARELTLTSPYDGTTISFKVDDDKATMNGTVVTVPIAPFIDQGQTYIPLRFVADAIGAHIEWDQETQTATVTIE